MPAIQSVFISVKRHCAATFAAKSQAVLGASKKLFALKCPYQLTVCFSVECTLQLEKVSNLLALVSTFLLIELPLELIIL